MFGGMGGVNSGLVGVSHTTGEDYQAMPSKSAIKPAGSTIVAHTNEALAANDSTDKLKKFIQGDRLVSYTPQDNREMRSGTIEFASSYMEAKAGDLSDEDKALLSDMTGLLRQDSELDMLATMARNILIPA